MFERLKDFFGFLFKDRVKVIIGVFSLFTAILIARLFVLQIIKGADYQANYNLLIEKTETIEATRGTIYDRNGNVLAYNELAYKVTITDSGSYDTTAEKNETLNSQFYEIITNLEERGDTIENDFGIYINSAGEYEFSSSGTSLLRFKADVFGRSSVNDLTYNKTYDLDEETATAEEIMTALCDIRYDISKDYPEEMRYKICVLRYAMSQNSYQKYLATTIATGISEESLAYIKENESDFIGVEVVESSTRVYNYAEAFSHIIGYTGKISQEEYDALIEEDEDNEDLYSLTDIVGKSGIEQVMNSYLSGTKGSTTMYVDNVGNPIETASYEEAVSGGDVYLSIDSDLQVATYELLEQEIAGILYSKIYNIKEYNASSDSSASDILIPVYDVYYALINNQVLDLDAMADEDASDVEQAIYSAFTSHKEGVTSTLTTLLNADTPTIYSDLSEEYQAYATYIVKMLKSDDIILTDEIDSEDETQVAWSNENLSLNDYLLYCIEEGWIDISTYTEQSKYVDSQELYDSLVEYILDDLAGDSSFERLVCKYAILNDEITGNQLCAALYDQGVLEADDTTRNSLVSGGTSSYNFIKEKIQNLEITPAQLALDPCSGSCVVINPNTGEVLACVSYPGYDSNKLANSVDSSYYSSLVTSLSNPLYNHATQQETAPGSTFKIVSATAGLAEGVIDTSTQITDEGVFTKVSNEPECWVYPSTHGSINVSEAIRDSCNYFFYEVGYRLAGSSSYSDEVGIEKLTTYATLYGLADTTGIEIDESTPHIATEYPVMAAIGQSDNNFTTVVLARYAAAVANSGTVYNLTLLDHVTDSEGETIATYSPEVKNTVDVLDSNEWSAIHYGMRMVVESLDAYDDFSVEVAGKTGTAQESKSRANHALFIGYAPYSSPEVAVATRIPYGYSSHNAAEVTRNILGVYFGMEEYEQMVEDGVADVSSESNTVTD